MQFDKELIRGLTEPAVLNLIAERPVYGYEMIKLANRRTGGAFEWKEGTLYPCLHRLEAAGLLKGQWRPAGIRRKRRYYSVTKKGLALLREKQREWTAFSAAVNSVLDGAARTAGRDADGEDNPPAAGLLNNIRIVLVGPMYGGNIGSVCRAMANTGLSDLAVAAPQAVDMQEAAAMACSAAHILESRREFPTLADAVADCAAVVGATARLGLYRSHSRTPRELAPLILETAASGKVALVFGRENNGLTNAELALCTQIVQIPSSPEFRSLNLAQAVMICCHEIYVSSGLFEPSREKSPLAPSELRERMFGLWSEALLDIGFMKDDKAEHMMLGLRRILSRGPLSCDDVRIMMGIARQAMWASRGRRNIDGRQDAGGAKPFRGSGAKNGTSRRDELD